MRQTNDGAPCNLALILMPDEEGLRCMMVEATTQCGDIADMNDIIPKKFVGEPKVHLYDIKDFVADIVQDPDFAASPELIGDYEVEGVTHVALLEDTTRTEGDFMFSDRKVEGVSVMLLWCADRQCYRLMHCRTCAHVFFKWLDMKQEEWNGYLGQGLQSEARTFH